VERGENDLHMDQLIPLPPHHLLLHKIQIGLTFLMPDYRGCRANEAAKQVFLCLFIISYRVRCHRLITSAAYLELDEETMGFCD